eukprot:787867-Prorocentrum_minimum.AAC.1
MAPHGRLQPLHQLRRDGALLTVNPAAPIFNNKEAVTRSLNTPSTSVYKRMKQNPPPLHLNPPPLHPNPPPIHLNPPPLHLNPPPLHLGIFT